MKRLIVGLALGGLVLTGCASTVASQPEFVVNEGQFKTDVSYMTTRYGSSDDILDLGYTICRAYQNGLNYSNVFVALRDSDIDAQSSQTIIESAEKNLCGVKK